ncbi:MAG: phosphoribosylamine--glycine ligase [Ignavibacteria bacterium]|nr:phosphoribosylamine--glycine ligase [Ignavibacteria bacterium]
MKILLIGNGGRENALAWAIYNSPSFKESNSEIYTTIGSLGLDIISKPVKIKPTEIEKLSNFAKENQIDLTVVGPEIPLAMGIVDEFEKLGLKIFGPTKKASEIESSKILSKKLMQKYDIPTAKFETFTEDNLQEVHDYINGLRYPIVIKADGLAAGKGVIIAQDINEANQTIADFTEKEVFGESGKSFIVEEFLEGYELSIFVITDGIDYVMLPSTQDHKKIGEGDTGKNTGGMGAYAPAEQFIDEELLNKIKTSVIEPALKGLNIEGRKYKGCLYCGLMIAETGEGIREPNVIEFNCRFGDPETQVVVPLIKSDFLKLLLSSVEGSIKDYRIEFFDKYACCVVLASEGYPGDYEKRKVIKGLNEVGSDCLVFHAGTKLSDGNEVLTNGGRVLNVVGLSSNSLKEAISNSYKNVDRIHFENMYFRKDIGYRALKYKS